MLSPPETLTADRRQTALARRFLIPALPALEVVFLAMREETDRALEAGAEARRGKPYPYGYCLEVTMDVVLNLRARCAGARSAGARALNAFLANGGEARMVWGVLRDRYFQNAIQIGPLYVDVANDSVDRKKPKVEILPMAESGLELVRDVAHFARIAESYWDVRAYANTALPALAPLFPVILVDRSEQVLLQSKTGYMMRLLATDGFVRSEQWLRAAPGPPAHVVRALRGKCPDDVLAANPLTGADAAVEACRRLRDSGAVIDEAWTSAMSALYDRVPMIRIARSEPAKLATPTRLVDVKRTNARPHAGIAAVPA